MTWRAITWVILLFAGPAIAQSVMTGGDGPVEINADDGIEWQRDTKAYIARASYGRSADQPWKAGLMFGQSAIVHPDGTVLANAGHYEGIALAHIEVPFAWQRQRCGGYPAEPVRRFLREDRRPDVYGG